ncbi:hypothetical protein [Lysobacter enzymogenes]|uniref:hypothetical protein n=1 Tax=Lysobacter enzymogenes TaxID=69 RepID=UPI000F4CFA71|nr:hypothetical protein [Lysobacter enzymogenes]
MAEAGLLKWLRAVMPGLKPRASAAGEAEDKPGAPVYVPARRGPHARRGAAQGEGGNKGKGSARR